MEAEVEALDLRRHAEELCQTWQGRALAHTVDSYFFCVVLSVLAHNYDDAMPVLLRAVFPGFRSIRPPFLGSAGRVAKSGAVVAKVVRDGGVIEPRVVIFRNLDRCKGAFRRLADKLKLSDAERVELFTAVRRWVVADERLDPTMDPADPDAKRLVH